MSAALLSGCGILLLLISAALFYAAAPGQDWWRTRPAPAIPGVKIGMIAAISGAFLLSLTWGLAVALCASLAFLMAGLLLIPMATAMMRGRR